MSIILLVEDSEDDVFIMERTLKKASNRLPVQVTANGRDALQYLQGEGKYSDRSIFPLPSIIFLDLKLPYVHGFEVLAWLGQHPDLGGIPVAVLTSSPEASDREKALQLGAKNYLIKPPSADILASILKSI